MASSNVREMFEKGTRAFNAHDIEAFAALMADDVSTRAPGVDELDGKAAVAAYYRSWLDAFPDARVEIDAAHFLEEASIEEGVFSGTHGAPLRTPDGDLPPTGRSVRVEYMQVVRYAGGRMSSIHLVFDRLELLQQLGVGVPTAREPATAWRGDSDAERTQAHPH